MSFNCVECFDTLTIDRAGAEITCPYCSPVDRFSLKITSLAHGLGSEGEKYATASAWSSSTITFSGTRSEILADVTVARIHAVSIARQRGLTGRNSVSSGAIAIERRVRKALS
jgi:hypothetical protein